MRKLKSIKLPSGDVVRENDKVILKGKKPGDCVIYYAPEMIQLLEQSSVHRIEKIVLMGRYKKLILAAGWSWDIRNVFKISTEKKIPPKPELFDYNMLDI
jgi:hypothetical protein